MKITIKKNKIKYGLFLFGLATPLISLFSTNAFAQEVTGQSSCTLVDHSCPPARGLDIDQIQSSDITATVNINGDIIYFNVPGTDTNNPPVSMTASAISSTSSAISNAISAKSVTTDALNYNSQQTTTANIIANNDVITSASVPGVVTLISTAHGNSAQTETTQSGMDLISTQNASVGAIAANATAQTAPDLGALAINASAVANQLTSYTEANSNLVSLVSNQNNAAQVVTTTLSDVCCNNNFITQNALSVGNSTSSTSVSATTFGWISQSNTGEIKSSSESNTLSDGHNMSTTAQSVGNTGLVYNIAGYTQAAFAQYSNGDINSYAATRPTYYANTAVVGATSQGNSAVMSTIGSEGLILADQYIDNVGTVSATADFFGTTSFGGVGSAVASASGNGLVGFACSACGHPGIGITGDINQNSNANVNATVNINGNNTGYTQSYGLAAGNSATFIAQNGTSIR